MTGDGSGIDPDKARRFTTPRCPISTTSIRWRDTCFATVPMPKTPRRNAISRAAPFRYLSWTGDEALALRHPAQHLPRRIRTPIRAPLNMGGEMEEDEDAVPVAGGAGVLETVSASGCRNDSGLVADLSTRFARRLCCARSTICRIARSPMSSVPCRP
jgi:hypothetical protein